MKTASVDSDTPWRSKGKRTNISVHLPLNSARAHSSFLAAESSGYARVRAAASLVNNSPAHTLATATVLNAAHVGEKSVSALCVTITMRHFDNTLSSAPED